MAFKIPPQQEHSLLRSSLKVCECECWSVCVREMLSGLDYSDGTIITIIQLFSVN